MIRLIRKSTPVFMTVFLLSGMIDAPGAVGQEENLTKNQKVAKADSISDEQLGSYEHYIPQETADIYEDMLAMGDGDVFSPIAYSLDEDLNQEDDMLSQNTDNISVEDDLETEESQVQTVEETAEDAEAVIGLQPGMHHPKVAELQARLMELGFMDNAEPTEYYGNITAMAVRLFQRQNELSVDGVAGPVTIEMLMSSDAKRYLISKGAAGEDVVRIQTRLYETGFLSSSKYITGNFGDITEEAVKKMQEVNGLPVDGKVGQQTIELLYSDEIKLNIISTGEKSDVVLRYQQKLKELGYLTTTPDGEYGSDTVAAVKQFQSRNDIIVDGYLGPVTCSVLESPNAVPNGLSLGDSGDSVKRVQELLSRYGYISTANTTGYFGEITENAVKQFQKNNGLSADGMVGVKTMTILTGKDAKSASAGNTGSSSTAKNSSQSGDSKQNTDSAKTNNSQSSGSVSTNGSVSELIAVAKSKLGTPYVYGGKGPSSFDCSGFVYWCLNQVGVKQSYITSGGWIHVKKYVKVSNFKDIQAGDIIVVKGHTGIAAYNGTVIDASPSSGKIVHRELNKWWKDNFIVAWRIF